MAVLVTNITPKRGQLDADLFPNPLSDKPQTLFLQVERTRDQVSGLRLGEYWIAYEMSFSASNVGTCLADRGDGTAGLKVQFPQIPATLRILDLFVEIPTALVNSAGTQDIDGVLLNTDVAIADGNIAANTATLVSADAGVCKVKYAVPVTPSVLLAGAGAVTYSVGKLRLFVKALGYFEA